MIKLSFITLGLTSAIVGVQRRSEIANCQGFELPGRGAAEPIRYYCALSRLLAAAALESARFSVCVWFALGSQLPLVPGILPATGLKPGQQCAAFFAAVFFAGAFVAAVFVAVVIIS